MRHLAILLSILLCSACQSFQPTLPRGPEAYAVIPGPSGDQRVPDYRIGPLDVLRVNVFQEPDLSFEEIQVDASGNILLPLIGEVRAQGQTASSLSREIAARLGERYLVDPQVSVGIASSVSQRVTVEGNVEEPGVYDIQGRSTLLEAMARAKSPTRVAKLDEVVIFREVDGQRVGAVFDVAAIREGRAADPEVRGGDVVVVGFDSLKGAFRDFLSAAPIFNVFTRF